MNTSTDPRAAFIAEAQAFGFQVHHGDEHNPDPDLRGRWWWTLTQDGWDGIECGEGDFATEDEAWDAAIVAHANELMEA